MAFEGYSPETVDFLWGIRMNNNREWFLSHKQQYVNTLYEPTKALGAYVFQPFLDKSGTIIKVSRIYRDARMHHPLPYKESLWICIRQDVQWWAENPCLFFEINPDGVEYGFCFWQPKPAVMKAFRRRIAEKPEEFLRIINKVKKDTGMNMTAACYKRPEACPNPKLAEFFQWKANLAIIQHEDFSPDTFGPALGERVRELLQKLTPLYDYFYQF
ncbi:MAG: DUF2461 domain-containing protein [Ruminococcaceae bacterium]|nr:DUF2461 domain-containing protein [Oscillospiraceae bacterium]